MNNQILGFGHYYKLADTKQVFQKLDSFIRSRLRRYISRNKDSKDKQGNLILTNNSLQSLGLKSLVEIYQKYELKKGHKFKKKKKNRNKTDKLIRLSNFDLSQIEANCLLKLILNQLKELTTLLKKLERRLAKIEKKMK